MPTTKNDKLQTIRAALPQIWSCGGGTQSCAVAVLIIQGRLPKPDLAIIADTGREKQSTWNYFERYLKPGLLDIGVFLHRVLASEYSYIGTNIYNSRGTLMIPAFTNQEGPMSKLSAFCSGYWKEDVRRRFTSAQGIMPRDSCVWLGYSLDEPKRYLKKKLSADFLAGRLRFPLVDDVPLRRQEAIDLVIAHGWPEPPRSSCWMCPNLRDSEWIELQQQAPGDFAKAVEFDKELRQGDDPNLWLHRSGKALDKVKFKLDPKAPQPCDSGHCFV